MRSWEVLATTFKERILFRRRSTTFTRQQIPSHSEHLPACPCHESINLPRVLLDLSTVQHTLQTTWLSRELEQLLPLIFRQWRLLLYRPRRIFRFPLGLPLLDLCLFSTQCALIVREIIRFHVVGFDRVEEVVTSLCEERVDVQGKIVEGGREVIVTGGSVVFNLGNRGGLFNDPFGDKARDLVEEGVNIMCVVEVHRKFDEDLREF